jgi:hypothetical protein
VKSFRLSAAAGAVLDGSVAELATAVLLLGPGLAPVSSVGLESVISSNPSLSWPVLNSARQ